MGNVIYVTGPAGSGKTFKAIKEHLTSETVLVNNEEEYQALRYIARGAGKSSELENAIFMTADDHKEIDTAINRGKYNGKKTLIWDCNGKINLFSDDLENLLKVFDKIVVTVLTRNEEHGTDKLSI